MTPPPACGLRGARWESPRGDAPRGRADVEAGRACARIALSRTLPEATRVAPIVLFSASDHPPRDAPSRGHVLDTPPLWLFARFAPWLFTARALHFAALGYAARDRSATADALFELAAARCRADLLVEPLARLRVHQLMVRARVRGGPGENRTVHLEVERRLAALTWIESPHPPFALVPARSLLATWGRDPGTTSPAHAA
jgi:hypothetical protein